MTPLPLTSNVDFGCNFANANSMICLDVRIRILGGNVKSYIID